MPTLRSKTYTTIEITLSDFEAFLSELWGRKVRVNREYDDRETGTVYTSRVSATPYTVESVNVSQYNEYLEHKAGTDPIHTCRIGVVLDGLCKEEIVLAGHYTVLLED